MSVDGATEVFLSGPHLLDRSKNDQEVTLREVKAFTKSIRIRLKERDGTRDRTGDNSGNDLDLGSSGSTTATPLTRSHSSRTTGVVYNPSYTVTS